MSNQHGLAPGDPVDVHTRFSDAWVGGFTVAAIVPEGYRVRRRSDASLLPGYTSESDLRPSSDKGSPSFP
ncbi:MAG: hypothetical protein JWO77_713 [Ilumatobacteraceae bacterium]|nr:hypothetical protein [Ilumatobacteraceae bacterium]